MAQQRRLRVQSGWRWKFRLHHCTSKISGFKLIEFARGGSVEVPLAEKDHSIGLEVGSQTTHACRDEAWLGPGCDLQTRVHASRIHSPQNTLPTQHNMKMTGMTVQAKIVKSKISRSITTAA